MLTLKAAQWAKDFKLVAETGKNAGELASMGKMLLAATSVGVNWAANRLVGNNSVSFSWRNVVTSAAAAGAMHGIESIGVGSADDTVGSMLRSFSDSNPVTGGTVQNIMSAAVSWNVKRGIYGNHFKDEHWNFKEVARDAFGNAIGSAIAAPLVEHSKLQTDITETAKKFDANPDDPIHRKAIGALISASQKFGPDSLEYAQASNGLNFLLGKGVVGGFVDSEIAGALDKQLSAVGALAIAENSGFEQSQAQLDTQSEVMDDSRRQATSTAAVKNFKSAKELEKQHNEFMAAAEASERRREAKAEEIRKRYENRLKDFRRDNPVQSENDQFKQYRQDVSDYTALREAQTTEFEETFDNFNSVQKVALVTGAHLMNGIMGTINALGESTALLGIQGEQKLLKSWTELGEGVKAIAEHPIDTLVINPITSAVDKYQKIYEEDGGAVVVGAVIGDAFALIPTILAGGGRPNIRGSGNIHSKGPESGPEREIYDTENEFEVFREAKKQTEGGVATNKLNTLKFNNVDEFNIAANSAKPNSRYELGNYSWTTDANARVSLVEGQLVLKPHGRKGQSLQTKIGNEGIDGDVGFHLIGDQFDGPINRLNVVQGNGKPINGLKNLNTSAYAKLERMWKTELEAGNSVNVRIIPSYIDTSVRPNEFSIWYQVGNNRPRMVTLLNQAGQ